MRKRLRRIHAWFIGMHAGYYTGYRTDYLQEKFGKKKNEEEPEPYEPQWEDMTTP